MDQKKLKLFMCCHNGYEINPPVCTPIQCGAKINPSVKGTIPDIGDNGDISDKNPEYCELTAHYYAWKNVSADYYGFCHYRRFFCFSGNFKKPYIAMGNLKGKSKKLLGSDQEILRLCNKYGIIAPRSENMGISVYEHYCSSRFHYSDDLDLFLKILEKKAPEITNAVNEYLAQNKQYFCNMFIMDRQHFFEYCQILFEALEEFDQQKMLHGNFQADRTDGYLGEIFTGIYITYARKNGADIKELTRMDINCSFRKRFLYKILPPESRRRFLAKKIIKALIH